MPHALAADALRQIWMMRTACGWAMLARGDAAGEGARHADAAAGIRCGPGPCRDSGSVRGDAARATREKGEAFLEAAIEGVIELVRELKGAQIRPRQDHH